MRRFWEELLLMAQLMEFVHVICAFLGRNKTASSKEGGNMLFF